MAIGRRLFSYIVLLSASALAAEMGPVKNDTTKVESDLLANHIFDFGLKLVNIIIAESGEKNVVISPTSIAGLLAMTMLGSVGPSYEEIVQQIGFSSDILINQQNHRYLGALLATLNGTNASSDGGGGTVYASGLFVSANATVRRMYGDYVQRIYKASIQPEYFHQPDKARNHINNWVLNNTGGKIQEFLSEPLPIDTRLVLLSALRFFGQWAQPFTPEYTLSMPFQGITREFLVDQMLNFGFFNYVHSKELNCHMIVLPYNDSATSLYAIMPKFPKKTNLTQLLKSLDAEKIETLIELSANKTTVIRFPKMKLSAKVDLRKALQDLDIKSIFSPELANFALMLENSQNRTEDEILFRIQDEQFDSNYVKETINTLPNPGLYVDSVLHQVGMTIDEYGTEAVAVTAGILARSSERFIADSPFFFFIRDERTKLVTFSAAIFDPTS